MADVKEKAIVLLSSSTGVDMTTGAKQALYTTPAGKRDIPIELVIRDPSASLAGCDDVDFGSGTNAGSWLNNETGIGDMTATTDFMVLRADSDEYTIIDGDAAALVDRQFGIKVIDGADSGSPTATVDVFGYRFDS